MFEYWLSEPQQQQQHTTKMSVWLPGKHTEKSWCKPIETTNIFQTILVEKIHLWKINRLQRNFLAFFLKNNSLNQYLFIR